MNIGWYLLIGIIPGLFAARKHLAIILPILSIAYLFPLFITSTFHLNWFSFQPLSWIKTLEIQYAFQISGLSRLFVSMISGIGMIIFAYTLSYFYHDNRKLARLSALLQLFTVSMLALVLADDLIVLFIAWELTTLTSFLLVQFDYEEQSSRKAAFRILFVTVLGGLVLLCAIIVMHQVYQTWSLEMILQQTKTIPSPILLTIFILVVIGAMTKSAQVPFYFWLPEAMKAPTPVSAFLHSATMVNAGIYLLARLHPIFIKTSFWYPTTATVGLLTMIVGSFLALLVHDLKKILAYTSVFALGTMFYLLGGNTFETAEALVTFLVAHAIYKALLFMIAGVIAKRYQTRDIRKLIGVARHSFLLIGLISIATLTMAGLPPFFGFVAKELVYEAKLATDTVSWTMIMLSLLAGMFTAGASFNILISTLKKPKTSFSSKKNVMPFGYVMPFILMLITLFVSFIPDPLEQYLLRPAALATISPGITLTPSAWRDWPISFGLSLATVIGGLIIYYMKPGFSIFNKKKFFYYLETSYLLDQIIQAILAVGKVLTRITERKSFTYHLLFSISAIVLITLGGLYRNINFLSFGKLPHQWVVVVTCLVFWLAAFGILKTKNFFQTLICLNVLGLALALMFTLLGAPDVAMTQLLIEILTVIIIALAFRHNHTHFKARKSFKYRVVTALVAVVFGSMVSCLLMGLVTLPFNFELSNYYLSNSVQLAQGKNVVNIILVDFRAYDTLAEILVVAAAAIGIATLMGLKKRTFKKG